MPTIKQHNFIAQAIAVVCTANLANAILREDKLPKFTSSMTYEGNHVEHTTDKHGNFAHPFSLVGPEVQSIFYKESKTISTKLHRVKNGKKQAMKSRSTKPQQIDPSYFEQFHSYFMDRKNLLQATHSVPSAASTDLRYSYAGEVFIGTPQQAVTVYWNTSENDFHVEASNCLNCAGDIFKYDDSSSWVLSDGVSTFLNTIYNYTNGIQGTDRVCPVADTNSCTATDFEISALSGQLQGDVQPVKGMAGLSRGGSTIMPKLSADSDITEQTFSIYAADAAYIDFGAPNTSVYTDLVVYLDAESDKDNWTSKITGFKWGSSMNDPTEYAVTEGYAETTTGQSCISMPQTYYEAITYTILNLSGSTFEIVDQDYDYSWQYGSRYLFNCDDISKLPSFQLLVGGYWFDVLPEDYVVDYNGLQCIPCFINVYNNDWILGDTFMRGFYNIHKYDTNKMGFVPFTGSSKSVPELALSTPTAEFSDPPTVIISKIIDVPLYEFLFSWSLLLSFIGYLVWFFCIDGGFNGDSTDKVQDSVEEDQDLVEVEQNREDQQSEEIKESGEDFSIVEDGEDFSIVDDGQDFSIVDVTDPFLEIIE